MRAVCDGHGTPLLVCIAAGCSPENTFRVYWWSLPLLRIAIDDIYVVYIHYDICKLPKLPHVRKSTLFWNISKHFPLKKIKCVNQNKVDGWMTSIAIAIAFEIAI